MVGLGTNFKNNFEIPTGKLSRVPEMTRGNLRRISGLPGGLADSFIAS